MSNAVSNKLLAELYGQVSGDPFLMLVTLTHPTFPQGFYLVNNTENIISRGREYQAFPMEITLPPDDGETIRDISIEFDNVSLELIGEMRSITTPMNMKIEMLLASSPNDVEISLEDLKLRNITYDKQRISAKFYMDSFLNSELTSEKYTPSLYPGLF